jgi:hypothetical protein
MAADLDSCVSDKRSGYDPPVKPPNWELAAQQRLLATLIAGLPVAHLPRCLEIANDVAATSDPEAAHVQATKELSETMAAARQRLANTSASSVER